MTVSRIPADAPQLAGLQAYAGWAARTPYLRDPEAKHGRKVVASIKEAVIRSGLTDGDTISFHHAFREGDKVILQVVNTLADMGLRDLTLASSSLNNCHAGLVDYIRRGVITRIYTSGMRGELARQISLGGLLPHPVQVHSHGGRPALLASGELRPKVAFLGVPACDEFGNANGFTGQSRCGSLGYARVDAQYAETVVLLAESLVPFPHTPASLRQDQVDWVVKVDEIGDPSRINVGAARATKNPRDLLIARKAASVMEHAGYFVDGFSMQTGSGGASTATTTYLRERMERRGITARWALGGITGSLVELHERGLIGRLLDVQSFDSVAADSLARNPGHTEISAAEYASPLAKAACVDQLDMVILSALEIDLGFNVNVLTGSDGLMMGASGGHCDTAAGAKLTIVVAPLIRSRIPTVVPRVSTLVTPGDNVDVLVTDYGVAVNPRRPDVAARLADAGVATTSIEELYQRAIAITGVPRPIELGDEIVGVVRYRDTSVIDLVRCVASS
ncbi:MAG: citrate lyase subunit alpha [Propioniciclava sp.]|uniref:citrate lyase subunit alpha n=1 Tax=Propioniciclava sp. TaxID=2038686 RepID=UPI0039E4BA8C